MEQISEILGSALRAAYDVQYEKAINLLVDAIRKQNVKITNLQKEIEALKEPKE